VSDDDLQAGVFEDLKAVDSFNLKGNQLTTVKKSWFEPTARRREGAGFAATTFDLSYNVITDLPTDCFELLMDLTLIDLGHNMLIELQPGLFNTVTKLEELILSGNRLVGFPEGLFYPLQNLRLLNLDKNWLASLRHEFFVGLVSLQQLNLENNEILFLDAAVFKPSRSLTHLNLAKNALVELRSDLLASNTMLEVLHLEDNLMRTLPTGIWDATRSLRYLNILGNKWSCKVDPQPTPSMFERPDNYDTLPECEDPTPSPSPAPKRESTTASVLWIIVPVVAAFLFGGCVYVYDSKLMKRMPTLSEHIDDDMTFRSATYASTVETMPKMVKPGSASRTPSTDMGNLRLKGVRTRSPTPRKRPSWRPSDSVESSVARSADL